MKMMIMIMIIAVMAVIYILWQKWELAKFCVTSYQIGSPKLEAAACAAVIADLHGFQYGKGNRRLLEQVKKINPQAIFIPGDL